VNTSERKQSGLNTASKVTTLKNEKVQRKLRLKGENNSVRSLLAAWSNKKFCIAPTPEHMEPVGRRKSYFLFVSAKVTRIK